MSDVGKIVKKLRNRRTWLLAYGLQALLSSGVAVFCFWMYCHVMEVYLGMLQETPAQSRPLGASWPLGNMVILVLAHLQAIGLLFCCFAGWAIASFFVSIKGKPRDRVLIAMWDRIEELENKLAEKPSP